MSFSAGWLTLREPYDRRARNAAVLGALGKWAVQRSSVAVVDLACGLGSTLRGVTERLPKRQSWRLVDNDLSLLARAGDLERPPDLTVTPVPVDLARDLEAALDGPVELVTTSALLDLVSHEWLERFATEAAARRLPVYAALSYDGLATLDPVDELDSAVIDAVNQHQRRGLRRPRPRRAASRQLAIRSRRARPTGCSAKRMPRFRLKCSPDGQWRHARSARLRSARSSAGSPAGATTSRRAAHRCGSVTSTFSRSRSRPAEPSDRSPAGLRPRSGARASASAAPRRRAQLAQA